MFMSAAPVSSFHQVIATRLSTTATMTTLPEDDPEIIKARRQGVNLERDNLAA
jgi:hypothetical protein